MLHFEGLAVRGCEIRAVAGHPKLGHALQECACHEIGARFRTLELIFKLAPFLSFNFVRTQRMRPRPLDVAASSGLGRVHRRCSGDTAKDLPLEIQ